MRIRWSKDEVERRVRVVVSDLGLDRMPTKSECLRASGSNALGCAVIDHGGGFDVVADALGLRRSVHASRVGWQWEDWFAEQARTRGCEVVLRRRVKEPYDMIINGRTVDVKVANGAMVANSTQWTWRIAKKVHTSDVYVFIGLEGTIPPVVFIKPARVVPLTCSTARRGPTMFGIHREWIDRWDLLGLTT